MRSPEAIRRAATRFRERWRNDPEFKKTHNEATRRYRLNNPRYNYRIDVRYNLLKAKATYREIEFDLSLEEYGSLVIEDCCHYCSGSIQSRPGGVIDRRDSKIGYVKGNCVPCCYVCNVMKSDLSVDAFYAHISRILAHSNRQ